MQLPFPTDPIAPSVKEGGAIPAIKTVEEPFDRVEIATFSIDLVDESIVPETPIGDGLIPLETPVTVKADHTQFSFLIESAVPMPPDNSEDLPLQIPATPAQEAMNEEQLADHRPPLSPDPKEGRVTPVKLTLKGVDTPSDTVASQPGPADLKVAHKVPAKPEHTIEISHIAPSQAAKVDTPDHRAVKAELAVAPALVATTANGVQADFGTDAQRKTSLTSTGQQVTAPPEMRRAVPVKPDLAEEITLPAKAKPTPIDPRGVQKAVVKLDSGDSADVQAVSHAVNSEKAKAPALSQAAAEKTLEPAKQKPVLGSNTSEITVQAVMDFDVETTQAQHADPELAAPLDMRRTEGPSASPLTLRPETQRAVMAQLAQVPLKPDQPIELRLDPQELGQVRMVLSSQDQSLTLVMSAERPETLDLMRRHIDQLAQEFQEMGYTDLNFSFTDQDTPADQHPAAPDGAARSADPVEGEAQPQIVTLGQTTGLDLRL